MNPNTKEAYNLFHKGIFALARAEEVGFRVGLDYIKRTKQELDEKIKKLEQELFNSKFYKLWLKSTNGKVNINSNVQLSRFLYKVKKLEPVKLTETGQGATDEEALLGLGITELNKIIEIRKLKKVKDTYLTAYEREQVNGIIHPIYNLHLVRTFRSSADSPNFQNIPNRDKEAQQLVRRAIYPRKGHQFMEVDYSNLEVRIAACYHKDRKMIHYIKTDADFHGDLTKQLFMIDELDTNRSDHAYLRKATKNGFTFPQFYGDYFVNCAEYLVCNWGHLSQGIWKPGQGVPLGDKNLSDHLIANGIKSFRGFTRHVKTIEDDFWSNRFYEYAEWKEQWWKEYQRKGYVDTYTGFRCGGLMGKNDVINYPIQGSAFHCLLWSFIELDRISREEKWDTKLVGQIHDAIIFDVNPDEMEYVQGVIRRVTCEELPKVWKWIIVPLDVDMEICGVDKSWAEKN